MQAIREQAIKILSNYQVHQILDQFPIETINKLFTENKSLVQSITSVQIAKDIISNKFGCSIDLFVTTDDMNALFQCIMYKGMTWLLQFQKKLTLTGGSIT